ncbi:autophagy-related protein 13b isoform X2 [Salvia miltiorrhiza]|nr:autophagy-related protein 13b isoform X2 [Salvia miltiorrhiza]
MIVDVILMQRPIDWDPLNFSPKTGFGWNSSGKERHYYGSDNEEFGCEGKNERIIERWVLQYESKKNGGGSSGSKKRSNCTSSHALYKKSILLLRSLYATVRLLPAYKLFRDLTSSAQIRLYNLGHRVSSFVEPFTRREEADMQRFVFTPVDTSCGRLCLSVLYRSSVVDMSSDPSTPISPQFIPEYVGSPMAEPLKRFPSGFVSQGSPSSSPFGRRHSWSYDLYRASPPSANPSPSPSPTYSDSHASLAKQRCRRLPPPGLPQYLPDETLIAHMKNPSYDEYWPSPVFSPSPSPSPPTYVPNSHISKALLRCESAPVSIPVTRLSSMPSLSNKQLLPPSPPMNATILTTAEKIAHAGPHQTTSTADKLFSLRKDKPQKISGVRPSLNSHPSKSFSSRLPFQDDYNDGPFVVDDDELLDPSSRSGLFELPGHPSRSNRSQDAAVGALVRMLKKAPPLHQDTSGTTLDLQGPKLQGATEISEEPRAQQSSASNLVSSSRLALVASKTTANALEELHGYRKMKDSLLKSK